MMFTLIIRYSSRCNILKVLHQVTGSAGGAFNAPKKLLMMLDWYLSAPERLYFISSKFVLKESLIKKCSRLNSVKEKDSFAFLIGHSESHLQSVEYDPFAMQLRGMINK